MKAVIFCLTRRNALFLEPELVVSGVWYWSVVRAAVDAYMSLDPAAFEDGELGAEDL